MDKETLQKRIDETRLEIYPVDRLLPLHTVYSIFWKEYNKHKDRSVFFRDRKFQRMREGYAALFIAVSHQDIHKKEYGLIFLSDTNHDFNLVEMRKGMRTTFTTEFDLKEFSHNFQGTFTNFIDQKIKQKLETYNIVILSYRDMDGNDLKTLVGMLKKENSKRYVWILAAPIPEDDRASVSQVTVINKEGIVYNQVIDLDKWIDKDSPLVIFQDKIRIKPEQ